MPSRTFLHYVFKRLSASQVGGKKCKQESEEPRCGRTAKHGGALILLWGIVAHEVNGVLPDFSPHVHSRTRVHGAAHPVGGCPD